MTTIKKVLILYKQSSYQTYFSDQSNFPRDLKLNGSDVRRFKETHKRHFQTLQEVEEFLAANKIHYQKIPRGGKADFAKYDLIMTVGGDGTFLEAAQQITHQPILGINSDPKWSVGKFCTASSFNFGRVINDILAGRFKVRTLQRLQVSIPTQKVKINILNDVLVCHKNPAAMSRYYLKIGKRKEEQKSSGVWVATAAGSSGAICSAGGKILALNAKQFQYKPRELYGTPGKEYQLTGGSIYPPQVIKIISLMREGVIFADGSHVHFPFHFGEEAVFVLSPQKLSVLYT